MGCSSCSKNKDGTPAGCKNNGNCGNSGCNKLTVFDWLANMELPAGVKPFDIVEVRFKNSRKLFFRNTYGLQLFAGDVVAVESSPGHDIGIVSIEGELVKLQLNRKEVPVDSGEIRKVLRKANTRDIEMWHEARGLEENTMYRSRVIASELGLKMKISDVEYQGDKSKATFYYTADDRVDFRELIKKLADEFKVRIEMRQIGARQEAARVGGIGSCGRELCCATWLTDFRTVTTSAARYQQLSLNPQKLAGQCGKLKCCLNYELDMYLEAVKELPDTDVKIKTLRGTAVHFKTDIFKKMVWYIYNEEHGINPIGLKADQVKELIAKNKAGITPADLKEFEFITPERRAAAAEPDYANVVGQDSLTRFDRKKGQDKRNRNDRDRGKNKGQNKNAGDRQRPQGNNNAGQAQRKNSPGQGQQGNPGRDGQKREGQNRPPQNRDGQPRGEQPRGEQPGNNQQRNNRNRNNRRPDNDKPKT